MGPLPSDFDDRVYAGVLGKTIGVYLGRPFEGWSRARIESELGEVTDYVHERLGVSLVIADDDLSGTFRFIEAPSEGPEPTSREIGEHWRDLLLEERTILWWGGLGRSTEHTAFLRLKAGIEAPDSGSIATNGRTVAEQIGAQIFIDGWGMLHPNDPDRAAALADQAARVSHDGVAVEGARIVAATVAAAFDGSLSVDEVIAAGLATVPPDSLLRTVHDRLLNVRQAGGDWRAGMALLESDYGYDRFGGACHMVPNHGVILLALLWSEGSFDTAMTIGATAGWDTDCNLGNIGAVLGVLLGTEGIADRWRVFHDRLILPTADPGRCLSDVGTVAEVITTRARKMRGLEPVSDPYFARSPRGWEISEGPDGVRLEREVLPRSDGGGYSVMGSSLLWPGMRVVGDGATVTVDGEVVEGRVPDRGHPVRTVVITAPVRPSEVRFVGGPCATVLPGHPVFAQDADLWEYFGGDRAMGSNRDPRYAFFGLGEWGVLTLEVTLTPGPHHRIGLLFRAAGVRRWSGLLFDGQTACVVRARGGVEETLAECSFVTEPDVAIPIRLELGRDRGRAEFGGTTLEFRLADPTGFLGFLAEVALLRFGPIRLDSEDAS